MYDYSYRVDSQEVEFVHGIETVYSIVFVETLNGEVYEQLGTTDYFTTREEAESYIKKFLV